MEGVSNMANETAAKEKPRAEQRGKSARLRATVAILAFVAMGVGLAIHSGTGTISSFGWDYIATVCPLGALESIFGSWAFVPRLVIALIAMLAVVWVAGKGFCGWICPIPYVGKLFRTKKSSAREANERHAAARLSYERWKNNDAPQRKKLNLDSRHGVLLGALASTAIFGFPVFCLVCPVGLSVATFVLFWRMVQYNEVTFCLLLFPAIIILEVVVLGKWCGRFCPLGALFSLIGSTNRTFRPTVDHDACLRDTKGEACKACASACPEHIDPFSDMGERPMTECVKCRSCADACPASAITLPFLPAKRASSENPAPPTPEMPS